MTCQFREPPEETPCYSSATHKAEQKRAGFVRLMSVCEDHALHLRGEGWDVWKINEPPAHRT